MGKLNYYEVNRKNFFSLIDKKDIYKDGDRIFYTMHIKTTPLSSLHEYVVAKENNETGDMVDIYVGRSLFDAIEYWNRII